MLAIVWQLCFLYWNLTPYIMINVFYQEVSRNIKSWSVSRRIHKHQKGSHKIQVNAHSCFTFLVSFLGWGVGWKLVVLVIMIFAVDNNCGSLQNRPWIKAIYCIEWWLLLFFLLVYLFGFFFQAWWKIMIFNQIHAKCKNKLHDVSGSWL